MLIQCHAPRRSTDAVVRHLATLVSEGPCYGDVGLHVADRGHVLGRSDGDVLAMDDAIARGA
jgi:hypothetical protein